MTVSPSTLLEIRTAANDTPSGPTSTGSGFEPSASSRSPYSRNVRHAPWNEDDADTYAWANLFAGLALVGVGIAFLVGVLVGEAVAYRGVTLTDKQGGFTGVMFLIFGAALAVKGYGFTYSAWSQRRRTARRRKARRHSHHR